PFRLARPCWKLHRLWRIKVSCDGTRLFPPPCGHNPEPGDERGTMSSLTTTQPAKGLEGVVATTSSICYIDGEQGVLAYRGIDIHELADNANFEETCNLLWFGKLPTRNELKDLRERLARERHLDPAIINLLQTAPKNSTPMDVLRTAVSALSFYDVDQKNNDHEANIRKAIRLTSQIAMIVAAYDRIRKGKNIVEPDRSLSHAANFLLLLNGSRPSETAERALDIALILHADHELNASTFAARVTAATLSDMHSAITSAIGALKGPLHGGANEQVMLMVDKIKDPAKAEAWIRKAIADKMRLMGFGHRVYRVEDPRAKHLRRLATELGRQVGDESKVQILNTVARVVTEEKHIYPNVDLFSGAGYAAQPATRLIAKMGVNWSVAKV